MLPAMATRGTEEGRYEPAALQRLYDYWCSKRRGARLPGREEIDPLELPDLLPKLFLLDVVTSGAARRYRFRLTGTEFVNAFGPHLTGRWVDEIGPPGRTGPLIAAYETVVATRRPHFWRSVIKPPDRNPLRYRRLICPLAADGETVDMLIGVFAVEQRDRKSP
jgi:hypothetical protein